MFGLGLVKRQGIFFGLPPLVFQLVDRLGFRVQISECKLQGLGFRRWVQGFGFGVWSLGSGFRVWVLGFGFRV